MQLEAPSIIHKDLGGEVVDGEVFCLKSDKKQDVPLGASCFLSLLLSSSLELNYPHLAPSELEVGVVQLLTF